MIAAVAANGVIGQEGRLPWHLPEDLRHFKQTTLGHPVIMGSRTWEEVGRPLPGRCNIVISRRNLDLPDGVILAGTIEEALEKLSPDQPEPFIIGGQKIYELAMPLAEKLIISHLSQPFEGDTYFPNIDPQCWHPAQKTDYPQANIPFTIIEYHRTTPAGNAGEKGEQ